MSDTTRSNRDYVVSNANAISSSAKSAGVMGGVASSSFNSTSMCPSMEPGIVEGFLGTCKELLRRISEDADIVAQIGDDFVSLDNVMAGHASSLNMSIKSKSYEVGSVALGENKDSDVPSNEDIRKEIEGILAEKGSDFKLKDRSKEEDKDSDAGDGRNYGGYNNWGSNSQSGSSAPSRPSSTTPEKSTQGVTVPDKKTEPIQYEKPTWPTQDEVVTPETKPESKTSSGDVQPPFNKPEIITIPPQVVQLSQKGKTSTGTVKKYVGGTDTLASKSIDTTQQVVEEPFIEETPVVEEQTVEDYYEPSIEIPEDKLVVEQVSAQTTNINESSANNSSKGLKTAAAVIGVGAALGAAGYGASKLLKEKDEEDDEKDYGWGEK